MGLLIAATKDFVPVWGEESVPEDTRLCLVVLFFPLSLHAK